MAEKPACNKCGTPHWKFIKCADAAHENAREDDNAAVRALEHRRKTVPVVNQFARGFSNVTGVTVPGFHRNEFAGTKRPGDAA